MTDHAPLAELSPGDSSRTHAGRTLTVLAFCMGYRAVVDLIYSQGIGDGTQDKPHILDQRRLAQ